MINLSKTFLQFLKATLLKTPNPLAIAWNITSKCNFNCKYCSNYSDKISDLPYKDISDLMQIFAKMGTIRIHFLGGEPLCREDIQDIVNKAHSLGIKTSLFTNGFLLKQNFKKIQKVDQISISLDGPAAIQNMYRHPNSFNKITEAIDMLNEERINTRFVITLHKYNLEHVPFMINLSKKKNIPIKFHMLIKELAGNKDIQNFLPNKESLQKCISYIIDQKKKNSLIINSITGLKYLAKWPASPASFMRCTGAGTLLFQITPDGYIYPCNRKPNTKTKLYPCEKSIRKAMKMIQTYGCTGCWCSGTLEFNLACQLKIDVILEVLRNYKL